MKSINRETKYIQKIAKNIDIMQNYMSNQFKQLKQHELVEYINSEVNK